MEGLDGEEVVGVHLLLKLLAACALSKTDEVAERKRGIDAVECQIRESSVYARRWRSGCEMR